MPLFGLESPGVLLPATVIGWIGLFVLGIRAVGMPGWRSKDAGLAFLLLGWMLALADALLGILNQQGVLHCLSAMPMKWHLAHDCAVGLWSLVLPAVLVIPAGCVEFSRCSGRNLWAHKWLIVGSAVATLNLFLIVSEAVFIYFT